MMWKLKSVSPTSSLTLLHRISVSCGRSDTNHIERRCRWKTSNLHKELIEIVMDQRACHLRHGLVKVSVATSRNVVGRSD